MKILRFLFTVFCILTMTSCAPGYRDGFAIYLVANDVSASEATEMDLDQIPLETEPLISSKDILSYEPDDHIIELTPKAYRRFQQAFPQPVQVAGIPFVVCVGSQRIYVGALWTPVSSISYDGIIILQSFDTGRTTIQLSLGYPGPEAFAGVDPRSDARIMGALEHENKLKVSP